MLLFSAPVTCSDEGEGGNVFMLWHFITTSCKFIIFVFFILQFPRRREANISFLHEVGPSCLCKCFQKCFRSWVTACCFALEVWGKWLCAALVHYHRKQWNHQLEGKAGQRAHATVCSPPFGYCGGGAHRTRFRTTAKAKDMPGHEHCVSK